MIIKKSRSSTIAKTAVFAALTIAFSAMTIGYLQKGAATPAHAVAGPEDWSAGNIISDSIFQDGDASNEQELLEIITNELPACDTNGIGTAGYNAPASADTNNDGTLSRAEYGAYRGNPAPFTCLKDYRENPSTGENNYGDKPNPSDSKSTAQLIVDAGRANDINPRALLVLLKKESSLFYDDWPFEVQFRYAMGAYCPDGPNGAECDPEHAGFGTQINDAAELLRYYIENMNASWWSHKKPGNNTLLWNTIYSSYTDSSGATKQCGGTNVNILNYATAALYTYTPYQPNQASVNAFPAAVTSGSSFDINCAAYGNRNFFYFYNEFFGNPSIIKPYDYSVESMKQYVDQAQTTEFTRHISIEPEDTAYIEIEIKNTGAASWDVSKLRLGTATPRNRTSRLHNETWLNGARISPINTQPVEPGETAKFTFSVSTPAATGSYRENLQPLIEGRSWIGADPIANNVHVVEEGSERPRRNIFESGAQLQDSGIVATSKDANHVLYLESDGRLRLYNNFQVNWVNTPQGGGQGSRIVMQGDGNLVHYRADGSVAWNSGTHGNPGASLVLQTDGNLVIQSTNGNTTLWSSQTAFIPDGLHYVNNSLRSGRMLPGQYIETPQRNYRLALQGDGNLVLYNNSRAVWSTNTRGTTVRYLAMQSDGNLVLYKKDGVLWTSRTNGKEGTRLTVQSDGNLVIYADNGKAVWSTR